MPYLCRSNLLLVLLTVLAAGCVTRGDMDALRRGQDDILRAVARIEAAQGQQRAAPVRPPPAPPSPVPSPIETMAYPVGRAAQRGPSDAWVTIVVIEDFQCFYCQRVAPTLAALRQKYKDELRLVFKHLPLQVHERAMPVAVAAQCAAEQQRFWEFYDVVMARPDKLSDNDLLAVAKSVKLDVAGYKKCLVGRSARAQVTSDMTEAATFGISGTPSFFINGKFFSGAQPIENFERVITAELQAAKASNIPKARYYAQHVEQGGKKTL